MGVLGHDTKNQFSTPIGLVRKDIEKLLYIATVSISLNRVFRKDSEIEIKGLVL